MKYTYLAIDMGSLLVPFIASFHPRVRFYKFWAIALTGMLLSGLVFLLWDITFTYAGVWGFNPTYLLGIYFFNLPVEEVLFFLCIPYACMFSYYCLQSFWPAFTFSAKAAAWISRVLIATGAVVSIIFYYQKYTCATFLLLALFILLIKNKPWIGKFYSSYSLLLLPFLVVNGLLTGSLLDAPVVWYNSHEIIGWRILTIPVEDVFYGLILIGSQVAFFEAMTARKH